MNKIIDREQAERQGDTATTMHMIADWHADAARKAQRDQDSKSVARHNDIERRLNNLADML